MTDKVVSQLMISRPLQVVHISYTLAIFQGMIGIYLNVSGVHLKKQQQS